MFTLRNEAAHDKAYNKTCATREDSDQHAHPLIECVFYSVWAIQRGINENPCHTGRIYRLICIFAGHTGLILGFVRS